MSDKEYGKKEYERMVFEHFEAGYAAITDRDVSGAESSESPDFITELEGIETGVEVAEVPYARNSNPRGHSLGPFDPIDPFPFDPFDYWAEVWRIADQKNQTYVSQNKFTIPIILVLYSGSPPLFDVSRILESTVCYEDFDGVEFSEVWVMDVSDEYCSIGDPRRPPDMWGLKPKQWRGFHRYGWWDRKPFG